jgi:hypothetical protein
MKRPWIDVVIAALTTVVAALAVALVFIVVNDVRLNPPLATPTPTPFPSIAGFSMNGVVISDPDACGGCHLSDDVIGLRPIPALAHPVDGWRDCTACHATGRLVEVASGHVGITKDQCLSCHPLEGGDLDPSTRPHHIYPGQACTNCHGVGKQAPMPDLMTGRTACWLCHHSVPGLDDPASGSPSPVIASPSP